jgi:hypothetical protein
MKTYEDRINKNQKLYLVVKDVEDMTFMCTDPRYFDLIKNSIIISAEVAVETNGAATFRKIVHAETIQAGALPKAEPKPRWTGGAGGGSEGGGGGGRFKVDPYKQALIIRQSCVERGFETALSLLKDGHLDLHEGETVAQAIVRYAKGIGADIECWVRDAEPVEDKSEPVASPTAPVAAPTAPPVAAAAPTPPPVAVGSEFDGNLPY